MVFSKRKQSDAEEGNVFGTGSSPLVPQIKSKRPLGIIVLGILWVIGGFYNLINGFYSLNLDLSAMAAGFSDVYVDSYGITHYNTLGGLKEWRSWAVPTEMVLMLFVILVAVMQFITVYGLFKKKKVVLNVGLRCFNFGVHC